MYKSLCSLYETALRLPHISCFYSDPELDPRIRPRGEGSAVGVRLDTRGGGRDAEAHFKRAVRTRTCLGEDAKRPPHPPPTDTQKAAIPQQGLESLPLIKIKLALDDRPRADRQITGRPVRRNNTRCKLR
jgi:hypothetical protein